MELAGLIKDRSQSRGHRKYLFNLNGTGKGLPDGKGKLESP